MSSSLTAISFGVLVTAVAFAGGCKKLIEIVDPGVAEMNDLKVLCKKYPDNGVARVSSLYFAEGVTLTTYTKNACLPKSRAPKGFALAGRAKVKYPVVVAFQYGNGSHDSIVKASHERMTGMLGQHKDDFLVIDVSNLSPEQAEKKVAQYREQYPDAFKQDVRILQGAHGSAMTEAEARDRNNPVPSLSDLAQQQGESDSPGELVPEGAPTFVEGPKKLGPEYEQTRHYSWTSDEDGGGKAIRSSAITKAIMSGSGADSQFIVMSNSCHGGALGDELMRDEAASKRIKAVIGSSAPDQLSWGFGEGGVISTVQDQSKFLSDSQFKKDVDADSDGVVSIGEYRDYRAAHPVVGSKPQDILDPDTGEIHLPKLSVSGLIPNPIPRGLPGGQIPAIPNIEVTQDIKVYRADLDVRAGKDVDLNKVALWPELTKPGEDPGDAASPNTKDSLEKDLKEHNDNSNWKYRTVPGNSAGTAGNGLEPKDGESTKFIVPAPEPEFEDGDSPVDEFLPELKPDNGDAS